MKHLAVDRKTEHVVEIKLDSEYVVVKRENGKVYIQMTVKTAAEVAELLIGALPTLQPFEIT